MMKGKDVAAVDSSLKQKYRHDTSRYMEHIYKQKETGNTERVSEREKLRKFKQK